MIEWNEIPAGDKEKMIEIAIITGGSPNGCLGAMLDVINAETIRLSAIPAHLLAEPEKATSRPLPLRARRSGSGKATAR